MVVHGTCARLVLRQVWAHIFPEERQQDLIVEGPGGSKAMCLCSEPSRFQQERVETFFTTVRLTTNLIDGNKLFAEDEGDKCRYMYEMIECLRCFINVHNLKAFSSMGHAWKRDFNDRVAKVDPEYKKTLMKSQDSGAVGWLS